MKYALSFLLLCAIFCEALSSKSLKKRMIKVALKQKNIRKLQDENDDYCTDCLPLNTDEEYPTINSSTLDPEQFQLISLMEHYLIFLIQVQMKMRNTKL